MLDCFLMDLWVTLINIALMVIETMIVGLEAVFNFKAQQRAARPGGSK